MKNVACMLLLSALALVVPAQHGVARADGPKYGAAGCGLGSMVIGNKPGFMQVFAATTNASSGSQIWGIISGTSNCADTGGGSASAKVFIETNRQALAKDISRGQGETISSLTSLVGCENPAAVAETLQRNFKSIFPNAKVSDSAVAQAIMTILKGDATLTCKGIT